MLKSARLYYFSPTGGTKKLGKRLCASLAQDVSEVNLALPLQSTDVGDAGLVVAAAPVFGGRIPPFAAEKLRQLEGKGRAAAALAVFGNRAYDDALCELCDILEQRGFRVVAAGAFNAQHSIAPEVGAGRPDAQDEQELDTFARAVLQKLEADADGTLQVPGSRPYKALSANSQTPVSLESCVLCGACVRACPTGAVHLNGAVQTDSEKCILCMACTAACPTGARTLPAQMLEQTGKKLAAFKGVRTPNEWFV